MPLGDLWGPGARTRARREAAEMRREQEEFAVRVAIRYAEADNKQKAAGKRCTACADLSHRREYPKCLVCRKPYGKEKLR